MEISIRLVQNGSTPDEEIVKLRTTTKVNLWGYAIVDRTFDDWGELSNEFRHIFVFPAINVEKDESVWLYSGEGDYKVVSRKGGGYIHKFYWNADSCIWNDNGGDRASLIQYTVVNYKNVPPV